MSKYTKSGFSKPFGCCSQWKICEMGKKPEQCPFKTRDPETMESCQTYRRHIDIPRSEVIEVEIPVSKKEIPALMKPAVEEQLTLF